MIKNAHPWKGIFERLVERTVHGNSNALVEGVAIGTLEGGDLGQRVGLAQTLGDVVRRSSSDDLDIETVLLSNSQDGLGARVAL